MSSSPGPSSQSPARPLTSSLPLQSLPKGPELTCSPGPWARPQLLSLAPLPCLMAPYQPPSLLAWLMLVALVTGRPGHGSLMASLPQWPPGRLPSPPPTSGVLCVPRTARPCATSTSAYVTSSGDSVPASPTELRAAGRWGCWFCSLLKSLRGGPMGAL